MIHIGIHVIYSTSCSRPENVNSCDHKVFIHRSLERPVFHFFLGGGALLLFITCWISQFTVTRNVDYLSDEFSISGSINLILSTMLCIILLIEFNLYYFISFFCHMCQILCLRCQLIFPTVVCQ